MRTLITGINGFVGPWLAKHVLEQPESEHVSGMAWGPEGREVLADLEPELEIIDGDLSDQASLRSVVEASRPDTVFHLAGASSVAASWSSPAQAIEVNALGQLRLLEAITGAGLRPLFIVASSAEVYGRVAALADGSISVSEQAPVAPITPYGVSKASQELIAAMYTASKDVPSICMRLFNLIGPGQSPVFAASSFARQIAEIEAGASPPRIRVGDLGAVRDLTDVRDAARAFWLAGLRGLSGTTFNLCSGRAIPIRALLDALLAMTECRIEVEVDPSRLRTADIPVLRGDPSRLRSTTGWEPELSLQRTLADLLEWWRGRIT